MERPPKNVVVNWAVPTPDGKAQRIPRSAGRFNLIRKENTNVTLRRRPNEGQTSRDETIKVLEPVVRYGRTSQRPVGKSFDRGLLLTIGSNKEPVKSNAQLKRAHGNFKERSSTRVLHLSRTDKSKIPGYLELRTDVKAIREKTGLSQDEFAHVFGIPLPTLRNWEQGRRKPDMAVCVLLHLIDNDPEGVAAEIKRVRNQAPA
jgi:putative transcriptional regulator